jgi:predicted NBD/HSP70 family sugar kinase
VETLISGTAIEKYYESITGRNTSLKKILAAHLADEDEAASMAIRRLIHFFGKGMSSIINVLDPDAIVLGGGLANIDLLYTEGVKEVEKHIFNPKLETPFLKPELGDSAGVFGAAFL